MALSPQYGWAEPDNSSLVKNGAADIRTLGDAIDTSVWNVGFGQAGKNKVINGDFEIWQRGTSFSLGVGDVFTADRYRIGVNGTSLGTNTVSRQTFAAGSAPVAGYQAEYFLRVANTSAGSGMTYFASDNCWIEDVRNYAGQTVTLSFWAKSNAARTMAMDFYQIFGTGGSSPVQTALTSVSLTTSWTRFTVTFTAPSISGKTIGVGSCSFVRMFHPQNATFEFDIWGLQIEYGSKATPFQTATGTIQGELVACMRYFQKTYSQPTAPATAVNEGSIVGINVGTTLIGGLGRFAVVMRTVPTIVLYSVATGASGKIRSGGADINGTASDVGDGVIGYITSSGLVPASNSIIQYTASAEL